MKLELETYTPSEAEEITGVKQSTVRNWRRAEYLPRRKGHARYNIGDLLVMFVMGQMVARGTTPETAKDFASHAARAVFQSTIWHKQAFADCVHSAAKEEVGKVSGEQLGRFAEIEPEKEKVRELTQDAYRQKAMAEAAEKLAGISGLKCPTWFIIWANSEIQFYHDEDISEETFFGNTVFDEFVEGPVTLFCLGAMAGMFIRRLPRPAIKLAEDQS